MLVSKARATCASLCPLARNRMTSALKQSRRGVVVAREGFTTYNRNRCQIMARITALVYNWWSIFMRPGVPDKHAEAINSRLWRCTASRAGPSTAIKPRWRSPVRQGWTDRRVSDQGRCLSQAHKRDCGAVNQGLRVAPHCQRGLSAVSQRQGPRKYSKTRHRYVLTAVFRVKGLRFR